MELTLTVTIEEANMLLTAIQELPAKLANPLTMKLKTQAEAQLNPLPEPSVEPVVEAE